MRTKINSERKGRTRFTQEAAELLNLKNSLFLSLWKISCSEECDLETYKQLKKGGWRKGTGGNVVYLVVTHSTSSTTASAMLLVFGWGGERSSLCRCVRTDTHSYTHMFYGQS